MSFIPDRSRSSFYLYLTNQLRPAAWAERAERVLERPTEIARIGEFHEVFDTYVRLAIAALDLGFGAEEARRWLSEAAGCQTACLPAARMFSAQALVVVFGTIGIVGDARAARALAELWPTTRDGQTGGKGKGCISPHWHRLVSVLAAHHGDGDVGAALAAMRAETSRPRNKNGPEHYALMCELAEHCLTAAAPDPSALLAKAASANQIYWSKAWEDFEYEEWLALRLLAFAAVARDRGWRADGPDPHPAVPLALLRRSPGPVPARAWSEWPQPEGALRAAIEKARAETRSD